MGYALELARHAEDKERGQAGFSMGRQQQPCGKGQLGQGFQRAPDIAHVRVIELSIDQPVVDGVSREEKAARLFPKPDTPAECRGL